MFRTNGAELVKVRGWLPPLVWAGVIVLATSIPTDRVPQQLTPFDKVIHFLMYFGLSGLMTRWFVAARPYLRAAATAVAIAMVFAAVDEWHQGFIPGRSPEFADWVADSIGAMVGAAGAIFLARRRRPMSS